MKILMSLLLTTSLFGCTQVGQIEDVIAWTHQTVGELRASYGELKTQFETYKVEQAKTIAELETTLGHSMDADGNGKVDINEAKQAILEIGAKEPEKLQDINTWLAIIIALFGGYNANGTKNKILEKLRANKAKNGATN